MSHFKENTINFGTVKRHQNKDFVFEALPSMPEIKSINPHCGCTKVKHIPGSKQINVHYSAGEIPNQVQGNQPVSKQITIIYVDGTSDLLTIEGTKIR